MCELTVDELYAVFGLARKNAEDVITENETKQIMGDPDAYFRGIFLTEENSSDVISSIQKLSQAFPWINFNKRKKFFSITLENETNRNWIFLSAQYAIKETLTANSVDCYLDVNYRD